MAVRNASLVPLGALLVALAACAHGPEPDDRTERFDPNARYVPATTEWAPPALEPALGLRWLVCNGVPAEANLVRVSNGMNVSVWLPQGHSLAIGAGSFPAPATAVREVVLLQPRTRHVAVFAHIEDVVKLEKDVRLTIHYGNRGCTVPDHGKLRVVRIDETGPPEVLTPVVNKAEQTLQVDLDSLSTFAIAH